MLRKQKTANEQDIKLLVNNNKHITQKQNKTKQIHQDTPFSYQNKNAVLKIVQQK